MYYAYTTILGKCEEEFWESTPRKIYSQLEIHTKLHTKKDNKKGKSETLKVLD
nr:MAG TPA: hypothetical protein [Caudoviricetes sp.]